jgi:predicted DNA-binding transcriptional regulator AlpA
MARLLDIHRLRDKVPFGKTTLEEKIARREFPPPTILWGKRLWREDTIDRWIDQHFPLPGSDDGDTVKGLTPGGA